MIQTMVESRQCQLRFAVLVMVLMVSSTCRAFSLSPWLALRRDGHSLHQANDQHQQAQGSDPEKKQKGSASARLKPPRFTQTVHKSRDKSSSSSSRNNSSRRSRQKSDNKGDSSGATTNASPTPMNTDRVWQSRKKSLEELEDILARRWGTSLSAFTADDWDDDDDDDNNDANAGGRVDPVPAVFRAKPVIDPWAVPLPKRASSSTAAATTLREFYDEDDEGYAGQGMTSKNSNREKGTSSYDYMIAPQPAGGSGKVRALAASPGQESYFFRPPPAATADTKPSTSSSLSISKLTSIQQQNLDNKDEPSKQTRKERVVPVPLLDEDGQTIVLSIDQAQRLFQQSSGGIDVGTSASMFGEESDGQNSVDSDSEYWEDEGMDEDSSPLATMAAQSEKSWQDLGVDHSLLVGNLETMACAKPLPVQQTACHDIIQGRDVVIGTYTGSGKTLAFLAPLLQRMLSQDNEGLNGNSSAKANDELRVLIVAPGRELASQIVSVARQICEGTPYSAQLAIGGTTFSRNLQTIRQRKPNILVGTPGRLAELIVGKPGEKSGRLKTNHLQTLVMDEFDALLEYKPHREPTAALVERLQRRHPNLQSILCSATATDVLETPKFQRFVRPDYALALTEQDDVFVTGATDSSNSKRRPPRVSRTVMHGVIHVPHRRFALDTLRRILHTEPVPQQILMFVDNSRKVDLMVEKLQTMGILAAPLHGGSRNDKMDRAEVSKALREGYVGIVVATELAARGLDAPLLTHVINVDLPTDTSHYAHRAGRCGRGGRPGVVLNLTTDPKERRVPQKFADQLGVDMFTVDVRNGKLNVVDPDSIDWEAL